MSVTRVVRAEAGPAVRALMVAVVVVGVVFSLTTIPGVRSQPTFWVPVDGWLQGTGYALMSALAIARAVLVREHRFIWSVVAAAVTARSLGFLVYFSVVRTLVPQPYPSISDGFWLLGTLLFLVSMGERARRFSRGLSRLLVLDALMAGLTVAALAAIALRGTVATLADPQVPERALIVNLVYPVLDVVALVLIAGLFAGGFRPRPSEALVIAGIGTYSVVEALYLYELASGRYHPGTYLAALSYLGTLLPCVGAWARRTPFPRRVETPRPVLAPRPGLAVPTVLGVVCLLCLVVLPYTSAGRPLPVALLVAAVLVMLVRGLLTVQTDRGDAGVVIASRTQELTRFQALVETSNDFIAIAALDGSVLYVNPSGREMAGIPPGTDVTTTTIADYLTEEGIAVSLAVEQPAVQRQGFWEGESTLRNGRGGPPIPVAINSFLMRDVTTGEPFAMATVQRDITERRDAQEALNGLAEQRQELLDRLVQAQEDERSRIAADVHDDSVQALAAVELRLGLLRRQLAGIEPALLLSIERAHESVAEATSRLRHLLFDLESPALRSDLATALSEAAEYVFEDADVRWSFVGDRSVDLPEAARVTAYRVAKEALVNVRKHAGARHVEIDVRRAPGAVVVTVSDDGSGVAPEALQARPGHLGVGGMRDRAEIAGGRLEVEPRPEGGTRVRLVLPEPVSASVVGDIRREDLT